MKNVTPSWTARVDAAFDRWEQLRRSLQQREDDWAAAVTLTGDRQRLDVLRHDVHRLQRAADEALGRAMAVLGDRAHA